jgi:hypothetical protein
LFSLLDEEAVGFGTRPTPSRALEDEPGWAGLFEVVELELGSAAEN